MTGRRLSPSTSVSLAVRAGGGEDERVSSLTESLSATVTGASLTGLTVSVKAWETDAAEGSVAVRVMPTDPLKFAGGVPVNVDPSK